MRTNIEIDDQLMAEALRLTGLTTKRECVEEALRELIRFRSQLNAQQRIRALRGKLGPWEGDIDKWRRGDP